MSDIPARRYLLRSTASWLGGSRGDGHKVIRELVSLRLRYGLPDSSVKGADRDSHDLFDDRHDGGNTCWRMRQQAGHTAGDFTGT